MNFLKKQLLLWQADKSLEKRVHSQFVFSLFPKPFDWQLGSLLVITTVLSACGADNAKTESKDKTRSSFYSDPCAVALAPHPGTSKLDQQIHGYQKLAQQPERSLGYFERLGWAYIAKARVSFDPGYYKLAEQTAACMQEKQPANNSARLLYGHVLHNLHRFKEAETLAQGLVEDRGRWYDYGLYGDVLMEQGRLDAAIEAYQSMMNEYPGPQAYNRAAHVRWLRGDIQGAIQLMDMSLKAMGAQNKETAAWALVRLADYELHLDQVDNSRKHLSLALRLIPDYAPALLATGRIMLFDGNVEDAVEALNRAVQLNPLPEYRWAFIEALKMAGQDDRANQVELALLDSGAVEDRRTYALYLAEKGLMPERALALARQELDLRADVFTQDVLAWALRATGKVEEAYAYSAKSLVEGTADAKLFYHAAVLALETGRDDEAEKLMARASKLQHMLWPSQREFLNQKFAAYLPHNPPSTSDQQRRRDYLNPT